MNTKNENENVLNAVFREGDSGCDGGGDRRSSSLRRPALDLGLELATLLANIIILELHRERELDESVWTGREASRRRVE